MPLCETCMANMAATTRRLVLSVSFKRHDLYMTQMEGIFEILNLILLELVDLAVSRVFGAILAC